MSAFANIAAIPGLKIARLNRPYVHSPPAGAKRQELGQSIECLNNAFGVESGKSGFNLKIENRHSLNTANQL